MIENLRAISDSGLAARMKFCTGNHHVREDKEVLNAIKASSSMGLAWAHEGQQYQILPPGASVSGFPSVDRNYLVTTWRRSTEHSPPTNAVIFKANGDLHCKIAPPTLKSELANNLGFEEVDKFWNVKWNQRDEGTVVLIDLVFGLDYFERRVLYPDTCTFGKVVFEGSF